MSSINVPVPMIVSSDIEAEEMSIGQKLTLGISSVIDKKPYLFRASAAGPADVAVDKIVGGTVVWNQLIDKSKAGGGNLGGVVVTKNGDGSLTFNGANSSGANKAVDVYSHLPHIEGHKYLFLGYKKVGTNAGFLGYGGVKVDAGNGGIVSAPSGMMNIRIDIRPGDTFDNITMSPMVIDLTQMFGSTIADYVYSIERSTANAGVAWFRSLFPNDYYVQNVGELMSVNTSAHIMKDANETIVGSYQLDSSITLHGIPKLDANNNLYYDGDTYASDGTVTRKYEYRSYTSGDESLTDAITDGTHTVVKLLTSTTETAGPYTNPQAVSADGTEEYVDERDVPIPIGHETQYIERSSFVNNQNGSFKMVVVSNGVVI